MNSDDIAEGILKVVFVLAAGAGVAFVISSYPIPAGTRGRNHDPLGHAQAHPRGRINGAIDVLLGVVGFGAFSTAVYGYWVGHNELAGYGLLTLFGVSALHGLREQVNRWFDVRDARRLIGRP
jgi:hypothetical protein